MMLDSHDVFARTLDDVLSMILVSDPVADAWQICTRIEQNLTEYVVQRPVDPVVLQKIVLAAYEIRHFALIASLAEGLDDAYWGLPIGQEAISLIHHVGIIWKVSGGAVTLYVGAPEGWWTDALRATSEAHLLRALDGAVRPRRDLDDVEIVRLVATVALAGALGWSAGFRHAQRMLVIGTPATGLGALAHGWDMFGLPTESRASILAHARRALGRDEAEHDWQRALESFGAAPDIASAGAIWRLAEEQSRLTTLLGGTPLAADDRAALIGRVAAAPPAACDPVWVFMTWREEADRLIGLIACYLETNTRVIVSIGGDGRPADLALASAMLLADRTHMIARPAVTWGGPKLLFQNLLPVIEAFSARTDGTAWLSVVCDRSFPLHGFGRFADRLDNPRIAARAGIRLSPQYWHAEFDEETVEDLPARFDAALAELFETGGANKMIELIGSDYQQLPININYRINSNHINFGHTARSITGLKSFGAQTYALSPYDADFRWMSLTRLSEFVDTATEGGPTYTRSQHPWMVRWIHSVLKTQDLHVGDPFFVASRHYANHLFTNPDRFALFAATNSSMGPEMTFFDTYASTYGLEQHYMHLFSPYRLGTDQAHVIDPVVEDADASNYQFMRKVPADPRDDLLTFLARRIIDDSGWSAFHWVAAGPRADGAVRDPMPFLDAELMAALVGMPFIIRDLLDRERRPAILAKDGTVMGPDGALGDWTYADGWLDIRFADPRLREKRYCGMGANRDRLTLVPDEIVDAYNSWSAFLDFPLAAMAREGGTIVRLDAATSLAGRDRPWVGSPKEDSAMIAAFIDFERSTPTPTFRQPGRAIAIRGAGDRMLVLASIADRPALLRLRGAAMADGRVVSLLSVGDDADRAGWASLPSIEPIFALHADDVPGWWQLETFEMERAVELRVDGTINNDQGAVIGHWRPGPGGIRLFGIDGLRIALTSQARFREGRWRLSGWAKRNMREMQSFAIVQRTAVVAAASGLKED